MQGNQERGGGGRKEGRKGQREGGGEKGEGEEEGEGEGGGREGNGERENSCVQAPGRDSRKDTSGSDPTPSCYYFAPLPLGPAVPCPSHHDEFGAMS